MAKMFYSLEEGAQKLGMTEDEVRGLIDSGQLQEFKDGDRTMLKVDQVDLIAGGGDEEEGEIDLIPLADSGEQDTSGLAESGPVAVEGEDAIEQTGISIFDTEGEEEVDPSAQTQVTPQMPDISSFGDPASSGSGLSNIALESDDTSLGADLLEDVYADDDEPAETVGATAQSESVSDFGGDSGLGMGLGESAVLEPGGDLFEGGPSGEEQAAAAPAAVMTAAQPYDGPGSGLALGLSIATVLMALVAAAVVIAAIIGGYTLIQDLASMMTVYIIAGTGAVAALLFAGLGWFFMRNS